VRETPTRHSPAPHCLHAMGGGAALSAGEAPGGPCAPACALAYDPLGAPATAAPVSAPARHAESWLGALELRRTGRTVGLLVRAS
jgi:hypothetical protein